MTTKTNTKPSTLATEREADVGQQIGGRDPVGPGGDEQAGDGRDQSDDQAREALAQAFDREDHDEKEKQIVEPVHKVRLLPVRRE